MPKGLDMGPLLRLPRPAWLGGAGRLFLLPCHQPWLRSRTGLAQKTSGFLFALEKVTALHSSPGATALRLLRKRFLQGSAGI